MASPVWFLIASLFLVSVRGKAIYDNEPQSYYEKPESSSPAPSASAERKLAGMKELVLYLTPDQVQVLESAGAVVKPFPQFEKAFLQQQYQQSVEEQTEAPKEDIKQNPDLEEFYKVLNIQKINEDIEGKDQSAEPSTESPRPKYKYTSKPRLQDYAALYVQKKANRGKPYTTEYVRYLPNYEIENLKMESYRAKPVPGYRFGASQEDLEIAKYLLTEAPEIKKPKVNPQTTEEPESSEEEPERAQPESPVKAKTTTSDKGPVTFEDKVREYTKVLKSTKNQQPAKVREPAKTKESAKTKEPAKVQEEPEDDIETLSEEELIEKIRLLAREQEEKKKPKKTSPEIERQLSSLLAPLIQHKKITEAIAKEKEELANNEKEIHKKLKELKESDKHDQDKYEIELRKLNENLEKQNALAEKLAQQGVAKLSVPEVTEKPEEEEEAEEESEEAAEEESEEEEEEETTPKSEPTESKKNNKANDATPVVIRIPDSLDRAQLYPVTLDFLRSIQLPLKSKKVGEPKPVPVEKRIRLPEAGNVYVSLDRPYLVQQPDKLTLIRHIWEH